MLEAKHEVLEHAGSRKALLRRSSGCGGRDTRQNGQREDDGELCKHAKPAATTQSARSVGNRDSERDSSAAVRGAAHLATPPTYRATRNSLRAALTKVDTVVSSPYALLTAAIPAAALASGTGSVAHTAAKRPASSASS